MITNEREEKLYQLRRDVEDAVALRNIAAHGCAGALTGLVNTGSTTNVAAIESTRRYAKADAALEAAFTALAKVRDGVAHG